MVMNSLGVEIGGVEVGKDAADSDLSSTGDREQVLDQLELEVMKVMA
jgi:hypothetical protein